ncbi:hypothetical protein ACIBG5_04805 [Kribbella sp. NPDC050241]|uniref:hypothetical protein n=1 Tax=Kribbella sp. NPDC050241 TaxID=3364115 RepID=UPI00379A7D1E
MLRAVAYRMLGSEVADDAVQEAWIRLGRTDRRGREHRRLAQDGGDADLHRHASRTAGTAGGPHRT